MPACLAGICAILGWVTLAAASANAQTITVASLDDTTSQSGSCTLPEAIANANANSQVYNPCPAGDIGLDTIDFSVDGTIGLQSGLASIGDDLVLGGAGCRLS